MRKRIIKNNVQYMPLGNRVVIMEHTTIERRVTLTRSQIIEAMEQLLVDKPDAYQQQIATLQGALAFLDASASET